MIRCRLSLALIFAVGSLIAELTAQAVAPSPSTDATNSISANTSGSLGSYCSSQNGILTAIQADAAGQDSRVLNVTVPAELVQEVAQVNSSCAVRDNTRRRLCPLSVWRWCAYAHAKICFLRKPSAWQHFFVPTIH